ncbi:peptidase [Alteromonas stellipolaris]|nr:peptidase [Alteromonas stellipolaris]
MFPYGKTSQSRLNTCHADIQTIWNELSKYINTSVFCGHRGKAEQNEAFEQGLSELAWPNSKHNAYPSMAIDSGPYFVRLGNTDWKDEVAFGVFAGHVMLVARQLYKQKKITHLVRWGGDWDMDGRSRDERFRDLPHFELYVPEPLT